MAIQAYVKIKGSKQGQFKAETTVKNAGAGAIPIVRYSATAQAPRDVATGQASGKRQWQPIRMTKEWGASSPQLLNALTTNEVLSNVVVEFWRADQTGKEQLHYRITLQNATVSSITSSYDRTEPLSEPFNGHELEEIEFAFQSISVEDLADKSTAADNLLPSPVSTPTPLTIREPVRPVAPS